VTLLVAAANDMALDPLTTGGAVGIALVVVDLQVPDYLPRNLRL
jgi:hypothetical protein